MANNEAALRKLAETIGTQVATAKSTKSVQADQEFFLKSQVEEFEYTDGGITKARTKGTYITKPA
jgi:hypothetical protein